MANTTCPKCNRGNDESIECTRCGINFEEYEARKHQKLGEVYHFLSEGKFTEAKQIAEKLPLEFPDNRSDFLLLLSNINRDISIVEKCKLAQECYNDGEYPKAAFMLRNIKAFDKKLDEKIITLRRKIERYTQNDDNFSKAVDAFDKGNYGLAKRLFAKADNKQYRDKVIRYQQKLEDIKNELLSDAVKAINDNQLERAENKLEAFRTAFPDFDTEIEGFSKLVATRIDIKNKIFDAARNAQQEKRYLESKILYSFLGMQFADTLPQVQLHIREIGKEAVISLPEIHEYGIVDIGALGLDINKDGMIEIFPTSGDIPPDNGLGITPDIIGEGITGISTTEMSPDGVVDTIRKPVDFGGVVVADFIF